ncbi:MAG TPA: UDP-N-acetylenolpyruvoylglucosamine reductase, partial [Acidimicrobiaceae bacterium]|nr:UDP-N-acetylenolpyruvoylglucosamine reductase [Acidimicrobiaceae bacterium]
GAPAGTPAQVVGAGAAVPLPALARQSAARGLGGLEWAVGIPGSVGGAVRMNAGGHGGDIAACIESATVFDLRTGRSGVRGPDDLALGYRTSAVGPDDVVVGARLRCAAVDPDRARSELDAVVAWRRENQPGGQNAGSVFANPSGPAGPSGEEPGAGALIDGLGLKGHRLGTAHVSEVHANFIVADPDGSADDVAELIDFLADRVLAATGTRLRVEVRRVGFGAGDG